MDDSAPQWLDRAAYPFGPHYFEVGAGQMHYVDEGSGRPLVLVHGTPEWSFIYRHLIRCLALRYRCIAPDHIGFGLSNKPAGWPYLPAGHAENLEALIEHLGLEDMALVVHDYGGPIGLSSALKHPGKVRQLVIMNTWMWSLRGDPAYERSKLFAGAFGRFLYERLGFSPRVMMPFAMGDRRKLTRAIHRQYLAALPTPQARHGTWVLAREVLGSGDWYDALWQQRSRIQNQPALILWGMNDFAFRERELARWQALFPNADVRRFTNAGHFLQEELGPGLCPPILEFLAKQDQSNYGNLPN